MSFRNALDNILRRADEQKAELQEMERLVRWVICQLLDDIDDEVERLTGARLYMVGWDEHLMEYLNGLSQDEARRLDILSDKARLGIHDGALDGLPPALVERAEERERLGLTSYRAAVDIVLDTLRRIRAGEITWNGKTVAPEDTAAVHEERERQGLERWEQERSEGGPQFR